MDGALHVEVPQQVERRSRHSVHRLELGYDEEDVHSGRARIAARCSTLEMASQHHDSLLFGCGVGQLRDLEDRVR